MIATFPSQREEKRLALLEAVESIRDVLQAGSDEAERIGTLPKDSVDALCDTGLLSFKIPAVLGGAEADLLTQLDVFEAVTRIDPAAGWCLMIGAASVSNVTAFLPDEAIQELFVDGRPPTAAGAFTASGKATPVEGGYLVTGRWAFGSGIRHSQWISAGAWVAENGQSKSQQVRLVFPRADATIHDNWKVMGLQGTGSCDYSVSDLFVPQRFRQRRWIGGGPRLFSTCPGSVRPAVAGGPGARGGNPVGGLGFGVPERNTSRAAAGQDARRGVFQHRGRRRCRLPSVPLRRGHGAVPIPRPATLPAGHQRRRPAQHG